MVKTSRPVQLGRLLQVPDPAAVTQHLLEFALVPTASEALRTLSTLHSWLPKIHINCTETSVSSLKGDDVQTLRLNGVEMSRRDMCFLKDERCLNDAVLNFFLQLVLETLAPSRRDEIYLASTFFFQKLTSNGVSNGEDGWNNVQKWTRSMQGGLLARGYVVVPINEQNLHWWLAVICHPRRAMEPISDDDNLTRLAEVPRIVCLDSAEEALPKGRAVGFLRGYISREGREWLAAKQGDKAVGKPQFAETVKTVVPTVPTQENGYDCGVFIIEYLQHLLRDRSELVTLGFGTHRHWFRQEHVSHRRRRLRWICAALSKVARAKDQVDVSSLLQNDELRAAIATALTDSPKSRAPTKSKATHESASERKRPRPRPVP